jgi:hypothetical protein
MITLIVNGFEQVTAFDVECVTAGACDQADALAAMFRSIARLSEDKDIRALCQHGAGVAGILSNETDALRERVVKAGLVGGAS